MLKQSRVFIQLGQSFFITLMRNTKNLKQELLIVSCTVVQGPYSERQSCLISSWLQDVKQKSINCANIKTKLHKEKRIRKI